MAVSNKMYRNKTDIAHIFGVSNPTVYRRVEGIKKEIGKRYNRYAIIDNLIILRYMRIMRNTIRGWRIKISGR